MKKTLQLYSKNARRLKFSQKQKVNALMHDEPDMLKAETPPDARILRGCIAYAPSTKKFYCLPVKGYNVSTYELDSHREFGFTCNCQGWQDSKRTWTQFEGEMATVKPLLRNSDYMRLRHSLMQIGGNLRMPTCAHVGALYEHFAEQRQERREMNVQIALERWF